jgi:hypothetical protein
LTAELYRGEQRIERLNPPGTEPSVLTAPARWHATPKTIQGVHSPAEMRNLHRSIGYEKLAFSALLAALPTRWAHKAHRVARAKRSSTATTAG